MFFFQLTYMKLNLSTFNFKCFILKHKNKFIYKTNGHFLQIKGILFYGVCETHNIRILGGGATVHHYCNGRGGVLLWSQGHSRYEKWILREIQCEKDQKIFKIEREIKFLETKVSLGKYRFYF